jgi:hypothetical protein
MPFNFDEFVTLADELAGRPDEASKRSSISRAYYGVFHRAFPRAEANVGPYRNRGDRNLPTHVWCWRQYLDTNDSNCKQIGVNGDRMKKRRQTADYERNIANLQAEVQRQIADAHQFLSDIDALDPQYPHP